MCELLSEKKNSNLCTWTLECSRYGFQVKQVLEKKNSGKQKHAQSNPDLQHPKDQISIQTIDIKLLRLQPKLMSLFGEPTCCPWILLVEFNDLVHDL